MLIRTALSITLYGKWNSLWQIQDGITRAGREAPPLDGVTSGMWRHQDDIRHRRKWSLVWSAIRPWRWTPRNRDVTKGLSMTPQRSVFAPESREDPARLHDSKLIWWNREYFIPNAWDPRHPLLFIHLPIRFGIECSLVLTWIMTS